MDLDIARSILQSYILKKNEAYKAYKDFAAALTFISDGKICNTLTNVMNILTDNLVQNYIAGSGEWYPVESTPNRRMLLYKYLQNVNYNNIDISIVRSVYQQLIKCTNIEDNIVDILKVINKLLLENTKLTDGYSIMDLSQKISYIRDQHSEKWVLKVLETTMQKYLGENDWIDIMKELIQLSNFGMAEFLISSSVFKVISRHLQLSYISRLMRYVVQGFSDNNLAFGASLLFDTLIQALDSQNFICYFNIHMGKLFNQHPNNCSRTLATSFTKYIVPLCALKYKAGLTKCTVNMHLYYKLTFCKHIYIAKCYLKNRNYYMTFIQQAATSEDIDIITMGFQLLCHFHNSRVEVSDYEISLFQAMLYKFPVITPTIRRSIQYFVSQMVIHYVLGKNIAKITPFLNFYDWMCAILSKHLLSNSLHGEIISEMFCFTHEVLQNSSNHLVCPYTPAVEYELCPLYMDLRDVQGRDFDYGTLLFLLNALMQSTKDMPVIAKTLIRRYCIWFDESLALELYDTLMMALANRSRWTLKKSLHILNLMIVSLCARKRYRILQMIDGLVNSLIEEVVIELESAVKNKQDLDYFELVLHIKTIITVMKVIPLDQVNCFNQCKRTSRHIDRIVIAFSKYNQQQLFRTKCIRKSVEASLVAMLDLVFLGVKFAGNIEMCIDQVLFVCSSLLANNSMKKVLVTASQYFRDLLIAAPQYECKYIEFYKIEKAKCLTEGTQLNLRKSAGIRHFMHVILKLIKRSNFLEREIEALIQTEATHNDQLNLQLNLLECLISDTDLKYRTQKFVASVFKKALMNLESEHFIIKNASIQLISAITTRLLGPLSESGKRELSAMDVFVVYPELGALIEEFLFEKETSADVKISILCFLAESNQNGHIRSLESNFNPERLKTFFASHQFCGYAVEAYIACCSNNHLYNVLINQYELLNLNDTCELKTNNEIYVILRFTKRYIETYTYSGQHKNVMTKKRELLRKLKCSAEALSYVPNCEPNKLSFVPQEQLEDEEEETDDTLFFNVIEVNCRSYLSYLQYIDNFIKKSPFLNVSGSYFITILFKYLINQNNLIPEVIFDVKRIIINFLGDLGENIKDIKYLDHIQSVKDVDIIIQELIVLIICKKEKWDESDVRIVNDILESYTLLIPQNISKNKLDIITNIMENVVNFLYTYNINMLNFLYITFSLTYIMTNDKQLSNIYLFLTSGHIRDSKVALFLIINNLELYLKDKILQNKLLTNYLKYISKPCDFNMSYLHCDPSDTINKMSFEIKLNENVISLLDSVNCFNS